MTTLPAADIRALRKALNAVLEQRNNVAHLSEADQALSEAGNVLDSALAKNDKRIRKAFVEARNG